MHGTSDQLVHDNDRVWEWLHARSGLVRVADFVGIGRERGGQLVAAFGWDHHQDSSACLHTATEPGGYNRELLHRTFWVSFDQWGYKCLISMIQHGNKKSLNLATRLGFQDRVIIPEAHPSGGLHIGVLTPGDCPWYRNNKNERRRKRTISTESL